MNNKQVADVAVVAVVIAVVIVVVPVTVRSIQWMKLQQLRLQYGEQLLHLQLCVLQLPAARGIAGVSVVCHHISVPVRQLVEVVRSYRPPAPSPIDPSSPVVT